MVLWEITLGTAYFLGLKRTYRLALKLQRRLISPRRPNLRLLVRRRVRSVFDVALTVHKNIQQRDLEVGRNLGNWILRWLDRMKPSAQIRGDSTTKPRGGNDSMSKFVACQRPSYNNNLPDRGSHCQSLSSRIGARPKCFPTLSRMLRPTQPAGFNSQYRHPLYPPTMSYATYNSGRRMEGGFRPDIVQWMMRG